MEEIPVNRIANSGLITLDLETHAPNAEFNEFDIKDFLFHGLILREKDFRESLKGHDWKQYHDRDLVVYCSADAIIPMWAYMLIATYAKAEVKGMYQMTVEEYLRNKWDETINQLDLEPYREKKIIIKGCSDQPIPSAAYAAITTRLMDVAQSVMFGEACSTVPVYKQKIVRS